METLKDLDHLLPAVYNLYYAYRDSHFARGYTRSHVITCLKELNFYLRSLVRLCSFSRLCFPVFSKIDDLQAYSQAFHECFDVGVLNKLLTLSRETTQFLENIGTSPCQIPTLLGDSEEPFVTVSDINDILRH